MLPQQPDEGYPVEPPLNSGIQRRREERVAKGEACEFAVTHAFGPDHVVVEEGSGMTVNTSRSGMQLLLGVRPRPGQWLEVHLGGALHRSVSLVEVCWTKPVREEVQGHLYLVGCRLTFGPTPYWSF